MDRETYKSQLMSYLEVLSDKERKEAVAFYMEIIADRMEEGAAEVDAVASIATPSEAAREILANKITELRDAGCDEAAEQMESDMESIRGVEAKPTSESGQAPRVASESASTAGAASERGSSSEAMPEPEPMPNPVSAAEPERFFDRLKSGKLSALEWIAICITAPLWLSLLAAAFGIAIGIAAVVLSLYMCAWVVIACVWIVGGSLVIAAPCAVLYIVWGVQLGTIPYILINLGYCLFAFGSGVWVLRFALWLSKAFIRLHKRIACSWAARRKRNIKTNSTVSDNSSNTAQGTCADKNYGDAATCQNDRAFEYAQYDEYFDPGFVEHYSKRYARGAFFTVCVVAMIAGIVCVALGFFWSGMDWHVFSNVFIDGNAVYIGGVEVPDPQKLFLGELCFFWL